LSAPKTIMVGSPTSKGSSISDRLWEHSLTNTRSLWNDSKVHSEIHDSIEVYRFGIQMLLHSTPFVAISPYVRPIFDISPTEDECHYFFKFLEHLEKFQEESLEISKLRDAFYFGTTELTVDMMKVLTEKGFGHTSRRVDDLLIMREVLSLKEDVLLYEYKKSKGNLQVAIDKCADIVEKSLD